MVMTHGSPAEVGETLSCGLAGENPALPLLHFVMEWGKVPTFPLLFWVFKKVRCQNGQCNAVK